MAVDLHIHSKASDGTLTPETIVEKANRLGLSTISITDHDSVASISTAIDASDTLPLTVIPGIELSSVHQGRDAHILGYFIDFTQPVLQQNLDKLTASRASRAGDMVKKLQAEGLSINFGEVAAYSNGGAIGRPHVAQILLKHGFVKSINEAFERYLGRNGPAYVPKYVLEVTEVIDLIHSVGGVASLAHPGVAGISEEFLAWLKEKGLDAVEVWHSDHTDQEIAHYQNLATKYGFLATGGSDCHGEGKSRGFVLGSIDIPDRIIPPLLARSRQVKQLRS